MFEPKYRRKIIYVELKKEIVKILRKLCSWKQIEIIEAHVCKDYIHYMYIKIHPKYSVLSTIGFLKGKSSLLIRKRHGNLKHKYGNRSFWSIWYCIDTVGKNSEKIEEYNKKSNWRGSNIGSSDFKRICRPVYG